MTLVKICGINSAEAAAATRGADFAGFVFAPKTPREVSVVQAVALQKSIPEGVQVVAVCVDPADDFLETICEQLRPGMIQLHGQETKKRIQQVQKRTGLQVIKAVQVRGLADVRTAKKWEADKILFEGAVRGHSFDWAFLQEVPANLCWGLAGGLTPKTVKKAIRRTGAPWVDVSSGVEHTVGRKDPIKIEAFVRQAKQL